MSGEQLPAGWTLKRVGDHCTYYKGGTPFQKLEYSDSGIPVLAKGDIKPFGRLVHSGTRFVDPALVEERDFYITKPGDILMTTRDLTQAGDVLGLIARVPDEEPCLVNQGVNIVRLDDEVDYRFMVYWTNGPVYRAHMKARAVGSTQIHIRKAAFIEAPLFFPPLEEQRRIASVLGALDDKIELNRKMNRTLEAMAQAIFKSWFIDFDGVPASEMVESELGPIPKGWRAGRLGDVAVQHRLTVDPEKEDAGTPYIGLADMPQRSIALTEWGHASDATSAKAAFREDDILFGKLRPYFKKVGVAPCDGVCSSDIIVVRPRSAAWYGYVLGLLTLDAFIDFTTAVSTGTRMPRVSWKSMAGYGIAVPPAHLAEKFTAFVRPAVDRIKANIRASRTLAEIRDALLPRLISGEVRVPPDSDEAEAVR